MEQVQVKLLRDGARLPARASEQAAGADLYACLDEPVDMEPGETVLIPTGFAIAVPAGWAGLIYARSGLATKQGLAPANKVGVIDADYRGEVLVALYNHSTETRRVSHGQRIAQLVLTPCMAAEFVSVPALENTARGAGGFGSTGPT